MNSPDKKLKIAIVTGGGTGIGFAIAKKFTGSGIYTIIIGRDESKLQAAKDQLGTLCEFLVFDLVKLEYIPDLVKQIIKKHEHIDILVNNAGINKKKEFCEVTDNDFLEVIQTNVLSVFSLSREVVKTMLNVGSGCIINISSMAAQYGIPKVIAYTAAKSAIEGMTRAMAVELSPKGIRINAIAPGFIHSEMSAKALDADPERKAKVLSRTPMGFMGEPEDVGAAALFLASDSAKYITGLIMSVDGGNSIGF
ncbi:MAG: SDR family oxidoreductase [Pedobacter sp.]|nr:MAG: SDR family oxidoreductase [Pedobacter sp.]